VAPFDLDAAFDRDYHLIKNGPVHLFRKDEALDETEAWLARHGYLVHRLDAGAWTNQADFHRNIKAALDFPDYYGHNLDAFNDCLRDVAVYEYGTDRDATGTVLVFTGYDVFARREPPAAQVILHVIATQARFAMLFGHRLVCLIQADDPNVRFEPVGATPVLDQN
jgi:hypothetical protein